MKELYPIELFEANGTNRIGIGDMISRSRFRDVQAGGDREELIAWLKELGVTPDFYVSICGKAYALTEKIPTDLLKNDNEMV